MKIITITGTTKIEQPPNPYFHYLVCNSDSEFPNILNRGWNTYCFAEDVKIVFKDIPKELKHELEIFTWYESHLKIYTPSGKHITMSRHLCERSGAVESESFTL